MLVLGVGRRRRATAHVGQARELAPGDMRTASARGLTLWTTFAAEQVRRTATSARWGEGRRGRRTRRPSCISSDPEAYGGLEAGNEQMSA